LFFKKFKFLEFKIVEQAGVCSQLLFGSSALSPLKKALLFENSIDYCPGNIWDIPI